MLAVLFFHFPFYLVVGLYLAMLILVLETSFQDLFHHVEVDIAPTQEHMVV